MVVRWANHWLSAGPLLASPARWPSACPGSGFTWRALRRGQWRAMPASVLRPAQQAVWVTRFPEGETLPFSLFKDKEESEVTDSSQQSSQMGTGSCWEGKLRLGGDRWEWLCILRALCSPTTVLEFSKLWPGKKMPPGYRRSRKGCVGFTWWKGDSLS